MAGLFDDVLGSDDAKGAASRISAGSGLFDDVLSKPAPSSKLRRGIADPAISLLKGAISIPEAAVGIADIPTMGYAGKAAEAIGFRPKEAKAALDELYTPEQQAANQRVQEAKGFLPTIGAALENPSVIGHTVLESLPSMGAGAVVGRGVMAAAPKLGAVGAGAIGEGSIGAGLSAEQIRQQTADGTLSPGQAGAALASGVGTAALGAAGGKVAQKLGIGDVDTMLVGGTAQAGTRSLPARVAGGMVSEGLLEELPQSMQEQAWQNVALDKPVMEGVPEAGALGALAGGIMGAGGGIISGPPKKPAGALSKTVAAGEQSGAIAGLLPNLPNATMVVFPDGSTGTQKQFDDYLGGLPEAERSAAMARFLKLNPQPSRTAEEIAAETAQTKALAAGANQTAAQRAAQLAQEEAGGGIGDLTKPAAKKPALTAEQREANRLAAEQERAQGELPQRSKVRTEAIPMADVAPAPGAQQPQTKEADRGQRQNPQTAEMLKPAGAAEKEAATPAVSQGPAVKPGDKPEGGQDDAPTDVKIDRTGDGLGRVLTALEKQYEAAKEAGDTPKMRNLAHQINQAKAAEAPKKTPAAKAKGLTIGAAPNSAESISVRQGVIHIGDYPAQNFDTGEDVRVPDGANGRQIREALKAAGAIPNGHKIYGLQADGSAGDAQQKAPAAPAPQRPDAVSPPSAAAAGAPIAEATQKGPQDGRQADQAQQAAPERAAEAEAPVARKNPEQPPAAPVDESRQAPAPSEPGDDAVARIQGGEAAGPAVSQPKTESGPEAAQGKAGAFDSEVYRVTPNKDGKFTLESDESVIGGNGDGSPRKFSSESDAVAWANANRITVAEDKPTPDTVDAAAHEAATSPQNDKPEPTEAQKKAGNYEKGHVRIAGLDISIENPEGSTRSGTDPNGKPWSIEMKSHYGYILGTIGKDKDHIDVFVKPGTPTDYDGPVFIIDQFKANNHFDEHKVMLGFADLDEAKAGYRANYAKGWNGMKAISTVPLSEFKDWLATGDTTKVFAPITMAPAKADEYAGKWFGTKDKAEAFIAKRGAEATYRTELQDGKWLILPKTQEATPASQDLGAMFDDLMGEIGAGAEVPKAANRNKLAETRKKRDDGAHFAAGRTAFASGEPRELPSYYTDKTGKNAKSWLRGWDSAKTDAPPPRFGSAAVETLSSAESELRALAFDQPKTTGPRGDVRLGNERYVTFDDAMRYVREAVAAGVRPVAFQLHSKLDIAIGETDRLIAALNPQKKPVTPQVPAATSGDKPATEWQRNAVAASNGAAAFKRGVARVLPTSYAGAPVAEKEAWFSGWDAANAAAPVPPEAPRTAGQAAASAAKNTAEGFQNAIAGLGKLFGGAGKMSSGLTFDEQTYEQAKPLFSAAVANFQQAGADLKDVMKAVMLAVRAQFGDAVLGNMKPYIVRYVEDVRDGKVDYAERKEPDNAGNLQTDAVPERGAEQAEADAAAGDRDREPVGAGLADGRSEPDRDGRVPAGADQSGAAGAGSAVESGEQPSGAPRDRSGVRAESVPAAGDADHVIDAGDIGKGGLAKKYRDNVAAIRILKAMEAESRVATPEERKQLARYVGWGAMKGAFDPANKQWAKQHEELKALLTDAEFAAARKSTLDAHYTSPVAVGAMYDALARLGVTGGRFLEPSVGIGNFFGLMPADLRRSAQLHGRELDSLTARLVAALYPKANISQGGFEDFSIPSEYFDVVIGNPPFGSQPLVDMERSPYSGFSIHNYFLAKGIDKLRPGGVEVVVVSHNFLDAQDSRARDWIAARADLVGAVRLPNTAFKENAGTEVVTDILIFQKREAGQAAKDAGWTKVGKQTNVNHKTGESVTHSVGQYFLDNPQNVLGTPSAAGTMYGPNEYTVDETQDIKAGLAGWVETLPQNIFTPIERKADRKKAVDMAVPDGIKEGSYFVAANGDVMQRGADVMGEKTAEPWTPKNAKAIDRMKGMIALRDALRAQMRLERSLDATEGQIEANRKRMNVLYDRFLKDFGHLNNNTNRAIFLDDTEAHLLQALEFDYDKGVGEKTAENEGIDPREPSATKADIFERRVAFPPQDSMVVTTAKDALLASLNYRGKVDQAYMASVYQKPIDKIIEELGGLLFEDIDGSLVTADEYLSGDVKTKLVEARAAARTNPKYQRNVDELQAVIPADKLPSEISVSIGAAYIPPAIYQQFVKHITGGDVSLTYIRATGQWSMTFGHQVDPALNTGKFGTSDLSAQKLFELTAMGRGAVVKEIVKNADGSTTTYVKEKETEAAREKQNAIKAEWQKWLWEDADRADQVASIYNDKMNRIVNRKFDGGHLTFPGMNPGITLLEHQKNGVWRGLQSFQTLYDHVVGAGKTFVMATLAMEMRRTGVSRKPLFVVPNHLTMQWRSEFTRLYPGSNVLAATPEDFAKGKRERLFSKIVTGDWDAIVVGHSSLKKIGLPEATEKAVLEEQITELSDAIEQAKRDRGDRNIIRDMEGIKARLEAKMKARLAAIGTRDKVLTFDELGIDAMFVDEMHEFKNLAYNSTMDRVAGMGNPNGSSKAFDMFVKVRWLFDTFGDKTPFITATGTPVSNSLVEMFNMQRYMQYPTLKAEGLNVFDAWARQFGKVESVYEVAPSGSGYRQSSRFAKFTNLPALMAGYNTFADTITLDDLKAQEEAQGKKFPVPKLVGGRPQNIVAQRSPQVAALMGVPKAETSENGEILFSADLAQDIEVRQDDKSGKFLIKVGNAYLGQAETEQEARLKIVEAALSPKITVDPQSILGRFANLRQLTKDSKGKINALSLTGEANKAGLDFRLINPAAPDFPGSKINLAVDKMMEVYHQWAADKGAQLVFCDLSIPLSARSSYESKARRLYVKVDGELAMKRGTMHTADGFESLPFFIVQRGEKDAKRFDVFDAASGIQVMSDFRAKADAKDAAVAAINDQAKREKWIDARHAAGEIEQEAIDDYNNDNEVETEGFEFFNREDIAGVSGAAKFSVYDDIKAKLMARGVPEREIAFIHDYSTPTAKAKLFAAVNSGDVRFLLGSTPKMGAGTNVQKRLVGLHHIDAPWRPSDLEQREGRIIRRGNELYARDPDGFEVFIGRYATEQTYDTRRWQILEHKARGIEQLRNYDGTLNEIDDIEGEAANSADMKAAASGDPLILEETRARNDVRRLEQLQSGHADEVMAMNRKARQYDKSATEDGPKRVAQLSELIAITSKHPTRAKVYQPVTVGGKAYDEREAAEKAVYAAFEGVRANLDRSARIEFRGLSFVINQPYGISTAVSSPIGTGDVGSWSATETFSPSGLIQRLHNFVDRLPAQLDHTRADIAKQIKDAAAMREQAKQPFQQADELAAAREAHKKVQRALLRKGPTVPESQKPAVLKAIEQQKARLEALGFGDALRELIGSQADDANMASRGNRAAGQTAAAVRAEVGARIGRARLAVLERKGLVKIHDGGDTLPDAARRYPDVWGWFDGKTVHLVASNLAAGQAAGVFEHEVWHRMLRGLRLEQSPLYAKLMDRLWKIESNGNVPDWFEQASNAVPADERMDRAKRLNETAAYAIQQYVENPDSLPALIRRWAADMVAAVRAFFMEHLGWVPEHLTAADLAALARRHLRAMANSEPLTGPLVGEAMASRKDADIANGEDSINMEGVSSLFDEKALDEAESVFLSSFPASTRTYRRSSPTARAARGASERARFEFGSDAGRTRRVASVLGPFSGYETREIKARGLGGREHLIVQVFGAEQEAEGLGYAPALTITVENDGEVSIYGPPSESALYKHFAKRGWAEPTRDADGNTHDTLSGGFWTKLTGATRAQSIELLGDAHARALDWLGAEHLGFHWKRTTGATGNTGGREGAIWFSRPSSAFVQQAAERVTDLFQTSKTFNVWHKTVGTQFHKASVDADFGRVFKIGQKFLQDTSQMAMDAADEAPDLLPKLGSLSDVFRRGPKQADVDRVSAVMFDGTLNDRRYSDAELAALGLTEEQRKLYRQARAAIDKSIDDLYVTELVRETREQLPQLGRRLVGMSAEDAHAMVVDALNDALGEAKFAAREAPTPADREKALQRAKDLRVQIAASVKKFNRVQKLKADGYAPLMRFGKYTVDVTEKNAAGEPSRVFFGMFETEREANAAARKFRESGDGYSVQQGVMSQEAWRMFQGVSPESLELFADAIGADQSEVFQEYLRRTLNNRSALKRLIRRTGVAGFSQDMTRVLATFVTSNSRLGARNLNSLPMAEAVEAIPKSKGDVKDEAVKLQQYLTDPQEEASQLRGWLFVHFIGGSIASALTNMTQPLTMTAPYLAQYGTKAAGKAMATAARLVGRKLTGDARLDSALRKAEAEGITAPHEIHQLYAESIRSFGSNLGVRKALTLWGQAFSLAEAFNRRMTFIAAFRMAQENPALGNAFAFAEKAVEETQGVYNKGNRPDWARGAVGATVFTFKQFSISYIEFLKRLPPKQRALALAILFLAAGLQGWPFAEDVQDLIDTIGQSFGYNTNSKRWMHEFAVRHLGDGLGEFAVNGASAIPGVPLDVQARMGLGNLIPGSAFFKVSGADKSKDVLEFVGPVGGLVGSAVDAVRAVQGGRLTDAASMAMPVAMRNWMKAYDMAATGEYRDTQGRKVMNVDAGDAAIKAIGFQPAAVAKESRKVREVRQDIDMVRAVEDQIADRWARGLIDQKPESVREARAELADWNQKNPGSRIVITPAQIYRRVREAKATRSQRFLKTTPAEMRRDVAADLAG